MTSAKVAPKWSDCTTYSRDDKERIPMNFSAESGKLRIVVVSNHIHYKGRWIMHCAALGIDTAPLRATTKEQACKEALKRVENLLAELQQDLEAIPDA